MTFTFPQVKPCTLDGLRGYVHPEGRISPLTGSALHPAVTGIENALGKPALVRWSANTERELWRTASCELYADLKRMGAEGGSTALSDIAYADTLDRRVGQVRAYQREIQTALDVGSSAHKYIEWQIRRGLGQKVGPEPKVHPKGLWACMAVEDWFLRHQVKPIYVEAQVFAARGYAGTFDLLATVDGALTLIDWKSSKALYAEHDLQIAAYAQALVDMGHPEVARAIVIRIPKEETETEVEVHEVEGWRELVPTFHALCEVWQWWWRADQDSKAAWQAKRTGAAA